MKYAMDSWAREVKSQGDLPESFKDFFSQIAVNQSSFPYTIFAPPDKWYRRKANPKLICVFNDRVFIAEKIKKQISSSCYFFKDINYIETGTLLLRSWLKFSGTVDDNLTSIAIEYNTVVEDLFKSIVAKIRSTIHHLDRSDFTKDQVVKKELSKFDYLVKDNYKYMNFGKRSLLPGAKVGPILLQPDIRQKFLRYFHRVISFTHLTIVTDHELIIIKDDDSFKVAQHIRYGGIWYYIPFNRITKVSLEADLKENFFKMTVHLSEGASISSLFSISQKPELDSIISEIEKSKTSVRLT